MKIIRSAALLALIALMGLAGTVSAHTATSGCESITLARAPRGSTADILVWLSGRDYELVYDDVPGNGRYAIPVGTYKVVWSDGYTLKWIEVNSCEPTPTPEPTPSVSPTPTPTPTNSPEPSETPSPTPSPSGTPQPTPPASPTPEPTSSTPPTQQPTPSPDPSTEPSQPIPTLPPTDTADAGLYAFDSRIAFLLAALVATGAGLYMLKHPRHRRD